MFTMPQPAVLANAQLRCNGVHAPPAHDCHDRHARPHPPQFALSLAVATHAPPHSVVPAAHAHAPIASHTPPVGAAHAPDVRGVAVHCTAPPTHAVVPDCAHPPLPVDVHAVPSVAHTFPHSVVPASHCVVHAPSEHTRPAGHTLPHPPQCDASLAVVTHAPLHSVVPAGHATPQRPDTQVARPTVGTGHAAHDVPHDVTAVSDAQKSPQRCVPGSQAVAASGLLMSSGMITSSGAITSSGTLASRRVGSSLSGVHPAPNPRHTATKHTTTRVIRTSPCTGRPPRPEEHHTAPAPSHRANSTAYANAFTSIGQHRSKHTPR
jgi:hypothetical protein